MQTLAAEDLLTKAELLRVRDAIAVAEKRTSGEIRVHIEDHIEEDVLDHAAFIFEELGMHRTRDRNGVLIYLCVADRKLAVIGDEGINQRVPENFWNDVLGLLKLHLVAGRPMAWWRPYIPWAKSCATYSPCRSTTGTSFPTM